MSEKYQVIGLMSGTSLDGLDMACVEFSVEAGRWHYRFLATDTVAYDSVWQSRLTGAIHQPKSALPELNWQYGQWLGEQVRDFIKATNLTVDLVASHGHTVFHQPENGLTLQVGDGQAIANLTGVTTIGDFRTGDVALGGQGAPLVPIGDQLLFPEYTACLNLGGIANISYEKKGQRIAFDIGMANLPLNYFARELGLDFDRHGSLAANGKLNSDLFKALNDLEFYRQKPPKSLGIEWLLEVMLPLVETHNISVNDKLASLVHHEAWQIARVIINENIKGEILVTGGGGYNNFFVKQIKHYLEEQATLTLPTPELVEYKEALVFALMGVLRSRNEINCLKSVTGAREDSSAGKLFYPAVT